MISIPFILVIAFYILTIVDLSAALYDEKHDGGPEENALFFQEKKYWRCPQNIKLEYLLERLEESLKEVEGIPKVAEEIMEQIKEVQKKMRAYEADSILHK